MLQKVAALKTSNAVDRMNIGWTREPLVHFLLIGAALFGADHLLVARRDDPRVIVVTKAVDAEARKLFADSRGREPNKEELHALRQVWLDNEVLYREGLALQVDRGDTAIRERVIFKALSIVDANLEPPKPDEKVLRTWFEKHRAKYDVPARYTFQEAVLTQNTSAEDARALAEKLNRGTPGEIDAGLRIFKDRPRENIVQSYGIATATALDQVALAAWRAYPVGKNWHVFRLDARTSPQPASFDQVAAAVLQDWVDSDAAQRRTAAVRALAAKYQVRYEVPPG